MSCELTTGYTKPACASNGGTKAVVAYNLENRDTFTVAAAVVTALTMLASKNGYRITPDMASIDFTETSTRSRENNSLFYDTKCSIIIKDDTVETRALVDLLSKGFLGIIQEKENGKNIHYGAENGMTVETAEIVSGLNFEDLNGVTINLVGKEVSIAPSIDNTLIDGIIGA